MLTKEQLQDLINMLEIVKDKARDSLSTTLITACINILKGTVKANSLAWKIGGRTWNKGRPKKKMDEDMLIWKDLLR